ncbi:MAG: RnfABCDGE type electron transport complex subunit B [Candidatus Eisenbacteria bacterium]|uniref:Ion-translocating oxidoreductase complex subunit B n=1 Tax=Eiseniibacteriota bacterium TaxID=2212470 RepID=A0A937X8A3_UNCEI|nr:RnfABCDGE type electron transport complex subunit B [Candidatus Eisenbacteria bacterium]
MVLLGGAMSLVLGWANRAFHVPVDPRVEAVGAVLPGANCGGCGYVGCREFAEAVARGEAAVTLCTVGGASCAAQIAAVMGVEVGQSWPYRAVVHCAAASGQRLGRTPYVGVKSCASANLVAGYQGCAYGCLGLGDCVRACSFDAIHVVDGLARVDYTKCVGCRACAEVCPRKIITMVPFKSERMLVVACSNQDAGKDVKNVCRVGCIGCTACSKNSALIEMMGSIPSINYGKLDPNEEGDPFMLAVEKCPMEALLYVGRPSPADVEATKDEDLPERVLAEFESTVDKTEWRG